MNNKGKLWQYDANGKLRTYLEYGDIFLYNSSEKQTVHLGTYNNQHGYLYLYDGTSNTLRSWYDYTGIKFADSNGTQTGYYPSNVNLNQLIYYQKYSFTKSITAGTSGTRAAQDSVMAYKAGYRPIGVRLAFVNDSSLCNVVPFFGYDDESAVYVNFYRASGSAGSCQANIIVVFIRNEVCGQSW